jgi:NTE family protein
MSRCSGRSELRGVVSVKRCPFSARGGWVGALVLWGLLAVTPPGWTQPAPAEPTARPKVCLVLSGGGARGAAHVGVLRVLEELRVPVDCITGTSMGSIVGAAYASGTPLDEMERTLASLSTRLLFKDLPPREERAVRLKRDDATNLAPIEIGIHDDGEVLLPKGLVSGVQLESVLRRLSKVRGFQRFDELPIPFRAVATDLVSGKPVVLSQGELAGAMRASMSVPGAIEPVRLEGRLLVDGGLTDNLPVDVARSMGADIVIAVNLGTPLLKAESLTTILSVTDQMVNILTEQNVQASLASLKPTDVLVLPQLGDFSAANFDHLPDTVPIGAAAAHAVADRLAALAVPEAEYEAWRRKRLAGAPAELAPVDEIRFNTLEHVNPEIARSFVETQPNQPIAEQTLDRDMRRLFGTGDFEHVNYQLLEEPGRRILSVDAAEKSWGPNYLRIGLGLSSDFKGDAFFNLLASYRRTWMNRLGGEWRGDLQVGRTSRISTEFYQPLSTSQTFFVAPSASYERRPVDIYEGNERIARYDIDEGRVGFEAGVQFTRYGELRVGLEGSKQDATLDTGPPFLNVLNMRTSTTGVTVRGLVDQLDSVNFPRSGYSGSFNVLAARQALGSDVSFTRAEASGTLVGSLGEHSLNFSFKYGNRLGSDPLPATRLFVWGGLLQQSGYPTGALIGEELEFARLVYFQRLARWSLLDGIYAGLSLEAGRMRGPLVPGNDPGALKSFALMLGVDTPLGPFYLGYGRVNQGFDSIYLFLGRP